MYSYAAVKTASPVKLSELKNNRGFTTSVAVLMKGYSHFLTNPQIKDILVTENEEYNTTTYNIIYNTLNGVFLAIV